MKRDKTDSRQQKNRSRISPEKKGEAQDHQPVPSGLHFRFGGRSNAVGAQKTPATPPLGEPDQIGKQKPARCASRPDEGLMSKGAIRKQRTTKSSNHKVVRRKTPHGTCIPSEALQQLFLVSNIF